MEKYLPADIKREEFKLLHSVDNVFLFQIEYFTSIVQIEKEMDFSKSKSYVGGYSLLEDKVIILNLI